MTYNTLQKVFLSSYKPEFTTTTGYKNVLILMHISDTIIKQIK